MKKTVTLIVLAVVLVLLIAGAAVLYDRLSRDAAPDQLATHAPSTTEPAPKETTAPTEPDQTSDPTADTAPQETTAPTEPALQMAPDFRAFDQDGKEVRLSDYVGKPLVLNFWASWCGPCKSEMPEFNEAYLELQGEVQFLMVNMTTSQWETFETARDYIAQEGFSFPVLYDRQSDAANTYGVTSLPTTYFLDAEGHLIAQAVGAIDRETLQRGIDMIYTDPETP